jgi:type II secretory pathway component GspD/PulD (secretin)
VFNGTEAEITKLQKILPQVDIPSGEVVVRGVVYEVQTGRNDGSAFSLAASILGGKLGVKFGPVIPFDSMLSFQAGDIQTVISALANDSRFKIVSSPSLRVRSGAQGKFVVGQDVPVLGALSFPQGAGQAVQSVQYQSSGVIFEITPKVRGASVDVDLSQQMSSFVQTTSGVNNSPTLTKRQLETSITVADGDLVVLGGLTEDKDTASSNGLSFLPAFMRARSDARSKTEILLVLQLTKI